MSKYWKFALAATALIATTAFAVAQMESGHGHTSRSDGRNGRGHARANDADAPAHDARRGFERT